MKQFLFFALFISFFAFAEKEDEVLLRPGLWKMEMSLIGPDGNEINPLAAVEAALENMPPEQKKEAMAKMGVAQGMEKGGIKVCYTETMLKDTSSLMGNDQNCETKVISKSPKSSRSTFSCKDGTKGDASWKLKSPSEYQGLVNMDMPQKGKSTVMYKGKFVSKDCGGVKPMDLKAAK